MLWSESVKAVAGETRFVYEVAYCGRPVFTYYGSTTADIDEVEETGRAMFASKLRFALDRGIF